MINASYPKGVVEELLDLLVCGNTPANQPASHSCKPLNQAIPVSRKAITYYGKLRADIAQTFELIPWN
jgi:hypothetical protein